MPRFYEASGPKRGAFSHMCEGLAADGLAASEKRKGPSSKPVVHWHFELPFGESPLPGSAAAILFHLLKNMCFYFPLLVLKGIYHYWMFLCFLFFSRGLNQMEVLGWDCPSRPCIYRVFECGSVHVQALVHSGFGQACVHVVAQKTGTKLEPW